MDQELINYLDKAIAFLNAFSELAIKRKDMPDTAHDLRMACAAVAKARLILAEEDKA